MFVLALLCTFSIAAVGCTDIQYDRLRLDAIPSEYRNILPAASARQTPLGIVSLSDDFGRTDSILALLTVDRRIAAKMQATLRTGATAWPTTPTYRLRGVIEPRIADLAEVDPPDQVRIILIDLLNYDEDAYARRAHFWIAAGIVRMLTELNQPPAEQGIDVDPLRDALDHVPAGGKAELYTDDDGVVHFRYRVE